MAGNRAKTAKRKPGPGRPFKPGQSGNPSGRPKIPKEVVDAARAHTTRAIEVLSEILNDVTAKAKDRISAANALLDRGWGKPVQAVSVGGDTDDTGERRTFVFGYVDAGHVKK